MNVNLFNFRNFFTKTRYKKSNLPSHRDFFCKMLNNLNLVGIGVEVGVGEGEFSFQILADTKLTEFYSIDPWVTQPMDVYKDINNVSQSLHDARYQSTVNKLSKFEERSKIVRLYSHDAVNLFPNNSVDFIYIDANHSYSACKEDLNLWWLKLKSGGIFAGHDYLNGNLPAGNFGVKKAVDEFCLQNNLSVLVFGNKWPSWYMRKS